MGALAHLRGRLGGAAALAAVALSLAACGLGATPGPGAGGAGGEVSPPLRVMTSVKPLAALVEPVLGERGTVVALVPADAGHHSYAPRPGDVAQLERADVYFGNGLGLNPPAMELARATLPGHAPLVRLGRPPWSPTSSSPATTATPTPTPTAPSTATAWPPTPTRGCRCRWPWPRWTTSPGC